MTNSKSVDNYRFMTAKRFVMTISTYCLIDGIQFVICAIAPALLPFSQTVVRDTRNEVTTRIDRNKSPLKVLGKVAVGVVGDSRKFSGHPYIGRIALSSMQ